MTIDADREPDDILQASEHFNSLLESLQHDELINDLGDLGYLAQVSQELQSLPQDKMPVSDKADLRAAMLSEFRKQHAKPTPERRATAWYTSRSFVRLAVAACLILVFVFGSGGLLRISAASLPGEPFYGLKRLTEQVELAFTSAGARSDKLYEFVQTRLTEIQSLVAHGQTITETVATDTMASLNAAIQAQSDPQKREQIIGQTAVVFSEAQTQGKLSPATVLVALGTVDIPPDEFFAAGVTARATPTLISTASPTDAVGALPAATHSMTPSATATETATTTVTASLTNTATATDTGTVAFTMTPSPTGTDTPTFTATASLTNTATATNTGTVAFTMTPSPTGTNTPTFTVTASPTNTMTATYIFTPSPTNTSTPTLTATPDPTKTPKPTNVRRPTRRPTQGGKPEDAGGGKPDNPGQPGGKK